MSPQRGLRCSPADLGGRAPEGTNGAKAEMCEQAVVLDRPGI